MWSVQGWASLILSPQDALSPPAYPMHTKLSRISRLCIPISICSRNFLITPLPNFQNPSLTLQGYHQHSRLLSNRSFKAPPCQRTKKNSNPQVLEAPNWKRIQFQQWNPTSKSPNYSIADQITVQSTMIRRTHNLNTVLKQIYLFYNRRGVLRGFQSGRPRCWHVYLL